MVRWERRPVARPGNGFAPRPRVANRTRDRDPARVFGARGAEQERRAHETIHTLDIDSTVLRAPRPGGQPLARTMATPGRAASPAERSGHSSLRNADTGAGEGRSLVAVARDCGFGTTGQWRGHPAVTVSSQTCVPPRRGRMSAQPRCRWCTQPGQDARPRGTPRPEQSPAGPPAQVGGPGCRGDRARPRETASTSRCPSQLTATASDAHRDSPGDPGCEGPAPVINESGRRTAVVRLENRMRRSCR
jgi:hypothetical protein